MKNLVSLLKYIAEHDYAPGDFEKLAFFNYKSTNFLKLLENTLLNLAVACAPDRAKLNYRISNSMTKETMDNIKQHSNGLNVFLRDFISTIQEYTPLIVAEYSKPGKTLPEMEEKQQLKTTMNGISKHLKLIYPVMATPNIRVNRPKFSSVKKPVVGNNTPDEYGTYPVSVGKVAQLNAPDEYGTLPPSGGKTKKRLFNNRRKTVRKYFY